MEQNKNEEGQDTVTNKTEIIKNKSLNDPRTLRRNVTSLKIINSKLWPVDSLSEEEITKRNDEVKYINF